MLLFPRILNALTHTLLQVLFKETHLNRHQHTLCIGIIKRDESSVSLSHTLLQVFSKHFKFFCRHQRQVQKVSSYLCQRARMAATQHTTSCEYRLILLFGMQCIATLMCFVHTSRKHYLAMAAKRHITFWEYKLEVRQAGWRSRRTSCAC